VAALVTWLCHEVCDSTAGVYEAGGGFFRRTRWESTAGLFLTAAELGEGVAPKPEHVEAGKAALLDFGAAVPTTHHDQSTTSATLHQALAGSHSLAPLVVVQVVPETGTGNMGDFPGEIARHLAKL